MVSEAFQLVMAWLRLDEHLPGNAKAQALPSDLFKFWINLLCVCRKWKGMVESVEAAAWELRLAPARAQLQLEKLVAAGLVDRPSQMDYRIHDWNDWQYENDVSTERVRKFRERTKKQTVEPNETVSRSVPEQNRAEQRQNRQQQQQSASSVAVAAELPIPAAAAAPLNGHIGEYPLTLEELRKHEMAIDATDAYRLAQQTIQHCLSDSQISDSVVSKFLTDKTLSRAVRESYETGPEKQGFGLLLVRVPKIMASGLSKVRSDVRP